jgi:uncharacterized protein
VRESPALARLRGIVAELGSCVVAFSGGLDSTVLLQVAAAELGERCLAVTADSPALPSWDRAAAAAVADRVSALGAQARVIRLDPGADPRYTRNQRLRCYYCKAALYAELRAIADRERYRWVVDGTNSSDLAADDRPGTLAARALGVRSPLAEAGLSKENVRSLAQELGLPHPDRPSSACLASRIPFGSPITPERLRQVEAAELAVRALGFRQVRVRDYGQVGRVEVDEGELARLRAAEEPVRRALAQAGFRGIVIAAYRGRGAGLPGNEPAAATAATRTAAAPAAGAPAAGAPPAAAPAAGAHEEHSDA